MRKCWRINSDAGLDYQAERLARRESRSVSNMLFVLIKEALAARARGTQLSHKNNGAMIGRISDSHYESKIIFLDQRLQSPPSGRTHAARTRKRGSMNTSRAATAKSF
jgi:hypothetical protein